MSNNKKNVNNATKEEVKETKVETPENQGEQNNVQNPPAAVDQPTPEKAHPVKDMVGKVVNGTKEFFDKEKHPVRHAIGKGALKVGEYAVVAGVTVIGLGLYGMSKKNDDTDQGDSYDEDDEYDSYDEEDDDDEDVVDSEAKEIDE